MHEMNETGMKLVAVVSIIWDIYLRYSGDRKGATILSEKFSASIEHRYYYSLWGDCKCGSLIVTA